jgi:hypothetical protein
MNVRPAVDPSRVFCFGIFSVEELRSERPFTIAGYDVEEGGRSRIYRFLFPSLVQAVNFAEYVADFGSESDVWFSAQNQLRLFGAPTMLSVRFYSVDRTVRPVDRTER